ncbi:hypothetical protein GQ457_08G023330 [Hibiscus cannabinus]
MEQFKCDPEVTYNTMLMNCAWWESFECVQKDVEIGGTIRFSYYSVKIRTLCQIATKEGRQDPHAYRTLISGHCKESMFKAGYELLVLMLRLDFESCKG